MTPPQRGRHGCEAARKWRTAAPPIPSLRRSGVAPQPWPNQPHPTPQAHRTHCLPPQPPLFRTRHAEESAERPHLITVVRPSGQSSLRKVTVLLNRRGVVSFEQLLLDISEALGFPRWHRARVTRLYTTYAREVKGICDFFRGDVAFLALGKSRPELSRVQEALEELFPEHPHYRAEALLIWEKKLRPAPDKASKADSGYSEGTDNGKETRRDDENALIEHQADTAHVADTHQLGNCESGAQKTHGKNACRKASIQPNHLQKLKVRGDVRKPPPLPPPPDDIKNVAVHREVDVPSPSLCENCLARRAKRQGQEWINPLTGRLPLPPVSRKQQGSSAVTQEERKSDTGEKAPPKLVNPPPTVEKDTQKAIFDLPSDGSDVALSDIERLYEIGRVVGDGNFAVVRECRRRHDGRTLAAKIVERSKLIGREHMMQNELSLLGSLCHPRIVRLFAHHHTRTHSYLLMELVSGGDLFEAISERGKFSEAEAGLMVSDVSEALSYIHGKHIVHRDLKPENLLIEHIAVGVSRLKLGDFGLAMVVTEPVFTICGTPTYVAPEILSETGYGVEVDVWALGVILYILLCGFPPFRSRDRDQEELFQIIKQAQLHFLSPYWDPISEEAKSLVRWLLQSDPTARMTAEQTLLHPWVKAMASVCSQRALTDKTKSGQVAEEEAEGTAEPAHGGGREEPTKPGRQKGGMSTGRGTGEENPQQMSTQTSTVGTLSSKATPACNDTTRGQIIQEASPNRPNMDQGKACMASQPITPSPVTTHQSQQISPRESLSPSGLASTQPQTITGPSSPELPTTQSRTLQQRDPTESTDHQAEKPQQADR